MNRIARHQSQRGVVLLTVLIIAVLIGAFCMVSLLLTTNQSKSTNASIQRTKALFVAQSGIEDEISQLKALQGAVSLATPFTLLDGLAGDTVISNANLAMDNLPMGQYTVVVTKVEAAGTDARNVTLTSTGWVPSATAANAVSRTVSAVVQVSLTRSPVFDYVYFINNWGWYYGDTIIANGNVRSNGQFDGGNYSSTINPLPRYGTVQGTSLANPLDAGGLYSGWNVVNAGSIQGLQGNWTQTDASNGLCDTSDVGTAKYTHPWDAQVSMPNLTDLTSYETLAKSLNSTIKIGSTVVASAVVGDGTSEKNNLYLCGTQAKPIILNGPIVVRGDVMISGYVTGKGSIYASGNVYITGNINYVNNPPAFPTTKTTAALQSWMASANNKDALGLFARQHIVVGNYTDNDWQSNVSPWVADSRNSSKEDAGADGIPNTKTGRDGILGTADDDVLESDGVWTVDHYTAAQSAQGLIPAGKRVGDVIPGSGEDIDGNGVYDGTTQMSEFSIPSSDFEINNGHWEGILPKNNGTQKYSQLATSAINHLDCAMYTNHTIAMYTDGSGDCTITGCLVSRNEAMIYGTNHLVMNYDMRLLDPTNTFGFYLPKTWAPIKVLVWGVSPVSN